RRWSLHRYSGVHKQSFDSLSSLRTSPSSRVIGIDGHFVGAVRFGQPHVHAFLQRRGNVLADVVGLDGQPAVPAIDDLDPLTFLRAAEIDQRVARGAGGPA